jgi:uncharacterized protein YkwD
MRITQKVLLWLAVALFALSASRVFAADVVFKTPFVTRAEAVMLLLQARVATVPSALINDGAFSDVKEGSWYERYMIAGVRLGLVEPDPITKKLRPDEPVTRAEFLSMAVAMFDIDPTLFTPTYADVPPNYWYYGLAGVAQRYKLFPKDVDQKRLKGESMMTHGEVAYAVKTFVDADMTTFNDSLMRPASSWYQTISTSVQRMMNSLHGAPNGRPTTTVLQQPTVLLLPRPAPVGSKPEEIPALRAEVLKLVNEIRARALIPTLQRNGALEGSAQRYAEEMATKKFFGHVSPTGETLEDRMKLSGYYAPLFNKDCLCIERFLLGENLAQGQHSATEVVANWMGSPSHRQAILNASFSDTGIGISGGVWVMHFGGKQN